MHTISLEQNPGINFSKESGSVISDLAGTKQKIRERQPRAKLCVMGILPRKEMETRIAQIDAALQERLNGKDCTFINLAPQLTHKDGTIDHSLFRDGLHPNAEGYKRIAKVLKGYL